MRKNVKKQLALRVLSTAALVAMVSSIATAAFADTYDLNKGSVTVETKENGITYVTQLDNTQKDGYARNDKDDILHDYQDKTGFTITSGVEKTSNTITVETAKDQTTDVTLDNVHIEVDTADAKSGAIEIKGDGNTNLELNGDNTVLVKNNWSEEHAAIEKADKYGTGTLTITDDKNDDGTAKDKDENGNAAGGDTGKLVAGGYHDAAAIGGGAGKDLCDTSNITITGGEITAIGGNDGGCGIGGGGRPGGTGKNICIKGNAHVTAVGNEGAAIGGAHTGGNSITITDNAVVNAYGAYGAAIGDGGLSNGWKSPATTITISGNATVKAEAVQSASAIGAGQHGSSVGLTINIEENANVTAIGSYDSPAIGNRYGKGGTTTINITGGTVNAINSCGSSNYGTDDYRPAIGANIDSVDSGTCNVNINSSTGDTVVNAYIYGKGSGTAVGSTIPSYDNITHDWQHQYVPADSASYKADGSSHFGEINSAIVNCYNNGTVAKEKLDLPSTMDPYAYDAKPEAAASTAAPAAAAALPQTGANWLAVVGTALSGLFLLAAGFVLDRKNRRMN